MRKPGAFRNYRYRDDMFPDSNFKMAYDFLSSRHTPQKAAKEYLHILNLAAKENESRVSSIICNLVQSENPTIDFETVKAQYFSIFAPTEQICKTEVTISEPVLKHYDSLLSFEEEQACCTLN